MDLFKCVSSPLNVSFSQWTLCGQCHLYIEPITARLSLINNKCLSHTLSRSLIVWDACKNLKRMVSGVLFNTHLLLTVPVFYTFMAITCIHEFQTQFPTSQIDIYTTAYYIASFIGWVYISLFFFLKKKHVFSWGAGESFTMHNWGQWTIWRIQFSLFTTMQIPGLELRPSGLAARALNQWAISLTLHPSIDTS